MLSSTPRKISLRSSNCWWHFCKGLYLLSSRHQSSVDVMQQQPCSQYRLSLFAHSSQPRPDSTSAINHNLASAAITNAAVNIKTSAPSFLNKDCDVDSLQSRSGSTSSCPPVEKPNSIWHVQLDFAADNYLVTLCSNCQELTDIDIECDTFNSCSVELKFVIFRGAELELNWWRLCGF